MDETFIFTGPYLCPYKFRGAQYSLGLLGQIYAAHRSHVIDVIIASATEDTIYVVTKLRNDWYNSETKLTSEV
jgi:hypothetical protein